MTAGGAMARLSVAGPWFVAAALAMVVLLVGLGVGSGVAVDPPTLTFLLLTTSWGLAQATVGTLIALRRPCGAASGLTAGSRTRTIRQ